MSHKTAAFLSLFALAAIMCLLGACTGNQTDTPQPTLAAFTQTSEATPTPEATATQTKTPPHTPTQQPTASATLTPQPSATFTATSIPAEITDSRGAVMLLIPAGEFQMGSKGLSKIEEPIHTVYLDAYYIDKFEVSNQQYAQFLNAQGNQFEGLANWIEANDPDLKVREIEGVWTVEPGFENYPMNEMTWYGARAFCSWRGGRLPTEAEWEKAARGTDGRLYPWGDTASCEQANYYGCNYALLPVDSFSQATSPYGVFNMAGNIMEWVNDWYAEDYYANSEYTNPTGPETGTHKVFRGGAYINGAHHIRTTYRWPKLPVLTYVATGFRCASDVP